jgi:hypothetical protein
MHRPGPQPAEQVLCILCIPDQPAILHVRITLFDQPLDRGPRSALTLASHPLDVPWIADILCAEGFEIFIPAQFNVVILTLTAAARAPSSGFLSFSFAGTVFSAGCHGYLLPISENHSMTRFSLLATTKGPWIFAYT